MASMTEDTPSPSPSTWAAQHGAFANAAAAARFTRTVSREGARRPSLSKYRAPPTPSTLTPNRQAAIVGGLLGVGTRADVGLGDVSTDGADPETIATEWAAALAEFAGVADDKAQELGTLFASHKLPLPTRDAEAYLTHDFLERRLGVTKASDAARILLAVRRLPPDLNITKKGADTLPSAMNDPSAKSGSYSENTQDVRVFRIDLAGGGHIPVDGATPAIPPPPPVASPMQRAPTAAAFPSGVTWVSIVGKDDDEGSCANYRREVSCLQRRFEEQRDRIRRLEGLGTSKAPLPGEVGSDDSPTVHSPRSTSSVWDVVSGSHRSPPLPFMLVNADSPEEVSCVLRVCTPGTGSEDITVSELTNKWVILANSKLATVATVHRVDAVALAMMRDRLIQESKDAKSSLYTPGRGSTTLPQTGAISFGQMLAMIVFQFVQEFEIALDDGLKALDRCEAEMLNSKASNHLLRTLYSLDRKASVYERMIDLNQEVVTELTEHFKVAHDVAFLSSRWAKLRTKAAGIQVRSSNLLQLLLALSGHRMNERVDVLTKVSIVFTPLTFIAGIYGMNFSNMPELQMHYGYFAVLGVMGGLLITMAILMKIFLV